MTVEYHSFLIRIWRDADPAQDQEWHGQVEQIQSGSCWALKSVGVFLDAINAEGQISVLREGQHSRRGAGSISNKSTQKEKENV